MKSIKNRLKALTSRITQPFAHDPQDKEELVDMLNEASDRELLDADSTKMIKGVLNVTDLTVRDVMVPRSKMVVLNENMRLQTALPIISQSGHSRLPVVADSKERVIGILLAKDVLALFEKEDKPNPEIAELIRPATLIPEGKRLDILLKDFRTKRYHMAVVVDEYGSTAGLITIEDVLEQIVGDIEDEYDHSESSFNIRQSKADTYIVRAQTTITEFNDVLNTNFSNDEFDTIGGLVLDELSHMPKRGETITLEPFAVKVINTTKRQLKLLEFSIPTAADEEEVA